MPPLVDMVNNMFLIIPKMRVTKIFLQNLQRGRIRKSRGHNVAIFQLREVYNQHKDYVLDIIQKNVVYNDSYIESLFKQFEGTLFKNKEDVMRLVLGNYISEEDLGKRPLAKLTRDISEELGLL